MFEIFNFLEAQEFQNILKEFIDKDKFTLSKPLIDYIKVIRESKKALHCFDDYCRQVHHHLIDSPFFFRKIDKKKPKFSSISLIIFTTFNAFTCYYQGEKNFIHVGLTYEQELYEQFFKKILNDSCDKADLRELEKEWVRFGYCGDSLNQQ